jgi:ribosomal protein S19E (S16A)
MAQEGKHVSITVRDVAAPKFIAAYAEVLKNNDRFVLPKWVDLVKTGIAKKKIILLSLLYSLTSH